MSEVLLDRIGRPYTPVMLPELRRGVAPANAGQTYPAVVYTADDIYAMLDAMVEGARGRSLTAGYRNRAALVLLHRCGLRLGELLALDPGDIDLEAGAVTVRHGKGNKRRVVGIDRWAAEHLMEWLERRGALLRRAKVPAWRAPLFTTLGGVYGYERIQGSHMRESLKSAGARAEVPRRVHPHGFRHTFADDLQREGFPVLMIMLALGHAELRTTAVYLSHLRPHELLHRMRDRPAPGKLPERRPAGDLLALLGS